MTQCKMQSLSSYLKRRNFKILFKSYSTDQPRTRQVPRTEPYVKQRIFGGTGYSFLLLPLGFLGVAVWEYKKGKELSKVLNFAEEKNKEGISTLPDRLEDLEHMEYQKVRVKGRFDHSKELYLIPPSVIWTTKMTIEDGVDIVTPLKLSDRPETILVNRGYVSKFLRPAQKRMEGQIEEEVEIVGHIRLSEWANKFFHGDPFHLGRWPRISLNEMAEVAFTSPVFIEANSDSAVPGGPVPKNRTWNPNFHFYNANICFFLSFVSFLVWVQNFRRPILQYRALEFVKKEYDKI